MDKMVDSVEHTETARPRHEERDAKPKTIMALVIGLAVLTLVALVLMRLLFSYLAAREARIEAPAPPLAETRHLPPPPRLQVAPAKDLQQLRAEEEKVLNSYGWVNRQAGIVRIPIERAMELVADRGLPVRTEDRGSRMEDRGSQKDRGSRIEDRESQKNGGPQP